MPAWFPADLTVSFWVEIAVAIGCGGLIGLERQMRGKPIGIRTSILICLATEIFVKLGASFDSITTDPSRVLGQVVTGIGFLGAGVILARGGTVVGVTSAAVVWMLAAIGASIGLSRPGQAMALSLVTVAILLGVRFLELTFRRLAGGSDEPDDQAE